MKRMLFFISTFFVLINFCSCNLFTKNKSYLENTNTITVTCNDYYYVFKPKTYNKGIIFYPDENIKTEAYAELLHKLADEGYATFLAKGYKINNVEVADMAIALYKNITQWYIGGHSSGGTAVTEYLENNSNPYTGLFLLSSFSEVDLSEKSLNILSIYGSNDLILDVEKYNTNKNNLGTNLLEHIIEGGNYSYFYNGDVNKNDGNANISQNKQINETIKYIINLINMDKPQPVPPKTYFVLYIANGHGIQPQNLTNVTNLPDELPILSDDEWVFEGWYYDSIFTKSANNSDKLNENVTLYAKWTPKKYSINFDNKNHGVKPYKLNNLTHIPDNLPILSEYGYKFMGWYLDENFTQVAEVGMAIKSNITLYAKWEDAYYVAYAINGHGSQPDCLYNILNLPEKLPILSDDEWIFEGWYYDTEFTNLANALDTLTQNTILYAKWISSTGDITPIQTYTITYNNNGHGTTPPISDKVTTLPDELPTINEDNWKFEGWYLDENFENPAIPGLAINDDITLYAKWSLISYSIKYQESIDMFASPDQGFYYPIAIQANETGIKYNYKKSEIYNNALLHLRIDIGAFSKDINGISDIELTNQMLDELDKLFTTFNNAGCCVIVRFAYTYDDIKDVEPEVSIMLKHIEQFSQLLNKHKNMITAVEHGLVGPWGEMHSSQIAKQSTFNKLITKYLACLDNDVILLVRRPKFIYQYYGLNLETLDEFNYENNRIGCYNDGYLGSKSDLGTFDDRTKEIEFLSMISQNKPYGGEVTNPDENNTWNHLSNSCVEMFKTNLSYLNIQWNNEVIARWQNTKYTLDDPLYQGQSEFTYIKNHMGYRFVCDKLTYSVSETLNINLKIKNVGFGELYKNKKIFIILKNSNNQYTFEFNYNNELEISQQIDISNVIFGKYQLYLVLADDFNDSAIRGIRFANTDMYDETLKANKLTDITIN